MAPNGIFLKMRFLFDDKTFGASNDEMNEFIFWKQLQYLEEDTYELSSVFELPLIVRVSGAIYYFSRNV